MPGSQRVDLDPDRVELAGRPDALHSPSAAREGRPSGPRHADHDAALAVRDRHRAEHLGAVGLREQRQHVVDRARLAGDRVPAATPAAGGPRPLGPRGRRTRRGPSGPAPGAPGGPGSPHRDHPAAGPHQADRVEPPAQRLLPGAQVGPAERQPGVEQHHRGVAAVPRPARRRGWPPRSPGWSSTRRSTRSPWRRARGAREGAAQLLGRAGLAHARGAQPRWPHAGQAQAGARCRTSRHAAARSATRQRERAAAGPGSARGAAALAGQRWWRSRPGRLHQHRARRLASPAIAGTPARGSRAPCGSRSPASATATGARRTRSHGSRAPRGPSRTAAAAGPRRCGRSRRAAAVPSRSARSSSTSRACG